MVRSWNWAIAFVTLLSKRRNRPRHKHLLTHVKCIWKHFLGLLRRLWAGRGYFLRPIGLRSLIHVFRKHHTPEKPKAVLQNSFWIALSRCAVHLVPMAVFVFLLFINYWRVYIGNGFSVNDKYDSIYLALFQVAAKIQEILCLASLATLLLEILREELLFGNGLPLGLVPSHLWFTQPQSLLSPEYITAAQQSIKSLGHIFARTGGRWRFNFSNALATWKRMRVVLLLFILVLLATFIGPFSAVLLIPTQQTFLAGGTDYFLGATAGELWPNVVASDTEDEACYWANATQYQICPCGGYVSMLQRATLKCIYDSNNFRPSVQGTASFGEISFLTEDSMEIMPAMISSGSDRNSYYGWEATYQCQPNAYSVVLLQTLLRDWVSAAGGTDARPGPLSGLPSYIHAPTAGVSADSTYPLIYIRCSQPQNLSQYAETAEFQFIEAETLGTHLRRAGWSDDKTTKPVNISSLRRAPSDHLRAQWIPLSTEDFGPVSAGLLFELPWSKPSNTRLALSCTVAATWAQGSITRISDDYDAWGVDASPPDFGPTSRNISTTLSPADPEARNFNRRIELRADWLNLLTPQAPVQLPIDSNWHPSTLEHIFYAAGFDTMMQDLRYLPSYIGNDTGCIIGTLDPTWTDMEVWFAGVCNQADKLGFIERTVARLVADGLSRRLSSRAFDMLPSHRTWIVQGIPRNEDYGTLLLTGKKNAVNMSTDPSLVTQHVDFYVGGYGYSVSTLTDYLATAIAGIYLILSLSHVIWTLSRRKSSSSWDTAIDLMMLAWNSPPALILRGTSARIDRWDTYNRMVEVRAREVNVLGPDGKAESYLQLSLTLSGANPAQNSTIELQSSEPDDVVDTGSRSIPNSGSSESPPSTIRLQDPKYIRVEIDKKYY